MKLRSILDCPPEILFKIVKPLQMDPEDVEYPNAAIAGLRVHPYLNAIRKTVEFERKVVRVKLANAQSSHSLPEATLRLVRAYGDLHDADKYIKALELNGQIRSPITLAWKPSMVVSAWDVSQLLTVFSRIHTLTFFSFTWSSHRIPEIDIPSTHGHDQPTFPVVTSLRLIEAGVADGSEFLLDLLQMLPELHTLSLHLADDLYLPPLSLDTVKVPQLRSLTFRESNAGHIDVYTELIRATAASLVYLHVEFVEFPIESSHCWPLSTDVALHSLEHILFTIPEEAWDTPIRMTAIATSIKHMLKSCKTRLKTVTFEMYPPFPYDDEPETWDEGFHWDSLQHAILALPCPVTVSFDIIGSVHVPHAEPNWSLQEATRRSINLCSFVKAVEPLFQTRTWCAKYNACDVRWKDVDSMRCTEQSLGGLDCSPNEASRED
ncbi:hypothetical protein PHLGIDRAFT_17458 [Phlebiopsis gigantea 11061_1 CR5-6]|uniref:Uncharacterized protein n=1 Tax=Phlebiopsis gigantea (strain 11061_1 CR5-6) TaxID=745531 RepID=A0A0C3RNZ9_PHLG1|nr:hypothetical protein PHLGIDRAFT_17458 [Phlebiopsis gigantea 11061_1 CR5-6]